MASSGKRKTTMAKLNRGRKLRERRVDKQAKKDAQEAGSHPRAMSSRATRCPPPIISRSPRNRRAVTRRSDVPVD